MSIIKYFWLSLIISLTACTTTPPNTQAHAFDGTIKNNSLTINPDETLAVASYSPEPTIKVYDLVKKKLIINLNGYISPRNVAFAKDGKSFFISDSTLGVVRQIAVNDFTTLHEIFVGQGAFGFTFKGNYLLVNNEAQNTVSVINLEQWKIEHVITGFDNPRQGIKVGPSGRYVYVTNFKGDDVRVIDTESWQIVKTLNGIPEVRAIAISPDETKLYGASSATNSLRVVRIEDNTLIKTMPTGKEPYGAALSPDNSVIITGNKADNTIQVFATKNYSLIKTIHGFNEPRQAIIYSKKPHQIYVLGKDLSISLVDYHKGKIITTIDH